MSSRNGRTERLEIAADERHLSDVRDFIDRTCAACGFAPRAIANIRLAVDEACTNVIKHAYPNGGPGAASARLGIAAGAHRGWLEVRIVDQGKPFEGQIDLPQLGELVEARRKGGFGMFLMHRLMDEVRYETTPAGNEWILRKRLPQPPSTFARRMRLRYALQASLGIVAISVLAVTPLWLREGRQRERADLQALRALAFGLAEAARPALVQRAELTPEQTHLFEAVLALGREEPRILAVDVVDRAGTIWAADRAAATFTHFIEPAGLTAADADGFRQARERVDGHAVLHLAVPVRMGNGATEVGTVHLSVRRDEIEAEVRAARARLASGALAVDALALLLVGAALTAFLRPLQRLVDGVRGMASEGADLAEDGPGEIGSIAAAFNDMNARYKAARETAADHERLQQDLQVAREIQTAILPQHVPDIAGYEIGRLYRPAGEVGGDYYDFLDVGDGLTGVVVADVAGKGVPGSLVMGMLRTALRLETRRNASAGDVLSRLHQFLAADMRKGMFVTMLYVVLDTRHRVVSYASAGHTPMVLYRAGKDETFCLSPKGLPVGLAGSDTAMFEKELDVERLRLRTGDLLLLYTDGITEATNAAGEAYGEERLVAAVKRFGRESADDFVRALEADLAEFTGGMALTDDLTLVAIKEKQGAPEVGGETFRKLVDAIDAKGVPVADACRRFGVSPSTYYRLKRVAGDDSEPQQLSMEKGAALRRLAMARRDLGAREIAALLRTPEWGSIDLAPTRIHVELRRMGIDLPVSAVPAMPAPGSAAALPMADDTATEAPNSNGADSSAVAMSETWLDAGGLRGLLAAPAAGPGAALLQLEGCIDSTSCDALESLLATATGAGHALVVDLAEVAYVSSRGWGLLAAASARAVGGLALAEMRSDVFDVYRMLGFESIVPSAADRDAARARLLPAARKAASNASPGAASKSKAAPTTAIVPCKVAFDAAAPDDAGASLRCRVGHAGRDGEVAVIALEGILDTVSAQLCARMFSELALRERTAVLIDLSCIEFVSSAGWGCLTAFAAERARIGSAVRLFGMSASVARIYELLHLAAVLPSDDILADALVACGATEVAAPARVDATTVAPTASPSQPVGAAHGASAVGIEIEIGALQARLEPYGTSGRAHRLALRGTWRGDAGASFEAWLGAHATPVDLLLVDGRGLESVDAEAWDVLRRHAESLATHGGQVCVVASAATAPAVDAGLHVHRSVVEALRTQQSRPVRLETVRVEDSDFSKDAEIRREGWNAYVDLLRQAFREDAL